MAGRQTVPAVLANQKATHGHLAAVYEKIQSAASKCVPRTRRAADAFLSRWRRCPCMRAGVRALAPPDRVCPTVQQALAPGHPGG
jgi:hypothetical protein